MGQRRRLKAKWKKKYPEGKKKYQKGSTMPESKWNSEHTFVPLLEHDYSNMFATNYLRYPHYFDTVKNGIEVARIGNDVWSGEEHEHLFVSDHTIINKLNGYTALDDDLFVPKGYYIGDNDNIPVIFDSGYHHAVAPVESDFVGRITPYHKQMNGLGATVTIMGVGTVG